MRSGGELFSIARTLLRAGDELPKPNGIRLRECSDAALPGLINKNAEIVGLIFDGNLDSLGGDYGYDERINRAVSVHQVAHNGLDRAPWVPR